MHRRRFWPKPPWNVADDKYNSPITYHFYIQTQIGSAWVFLKTSGLKSLVRIKHWKYAKIGHNWFLDVFLYFYARKSCVCVNSFCFNFHKLMSQVQVLFNFKARAITSYLSPQKIILAKKKGANCDFSPTPENIGRNEKIDF